MNANKISELHRRTQAAESAQAKLQHQNAVLVTKYNVVLAELNKLRAKLPVDRLRGSAATPPAAAPQGTLYEVQFGDTFYSITQRFTGDGGRWRELLASNPLLYAISGISVAVPEVTLIPGLRIFLPASWQAPPSTVLFAVGTRVREMFKSPPPREGTVADRRPSGREGFYFLTVAWDNGGYSRGAFAPEHLQIIPLGEPPFKAGQLVVALAGELKGLRLVVDSATWKSNGSTGHPVFSWWCAVSSAVNSSWKAEAISTRLAAVEEPTLKSAPAAGVIRQYAGPWLLEKQYPGRFEEWTRYACSSDGTCSTDEYIVEVFQRYPGEPWRVHFGGEEELPSRFGTCEEAKDRADRLARAKGFTLKDR